jgi:hypothetical protein
MSPIDRKRQMNINLSEHEFGLLEHIADTRGVTASDVVRLMIRRDWEAISYLTPLELDAAIANAAKEGAARNMAATGAPTVKQKKR